MLPALKLNFRNTPDGSQRSHVSDSGGESLMYLQANGIDTLLSDLVNEIRKEKPALPISFIVDKLSQRLKDMPEVCIIKTRLLKTEIREQMKKKLY